MVGNTTYVALSINSAYDCAITTHSAQNVTDFALIPANNYTFDTCRIKAVGYNQNWTDQLWTINGTYSYTSDSTTANVMNNTKSSISSVIDWFPTFIVLGAMVVLILLVVIIIRSIKSSGITGA